MTVYMHLIQTEVFLLGNIKVKTVWKLELLLSKMMIEKSLLLQ